MRIVKFCGRYHQHDSHSWSDVEENGVVLLKNCFGLPEGDYSEDEQQTKPEVEIEIVPITGPLKVLGEWTLRRRQREMST